MSAPQIHLMLNHIPVTGALFAMLLLVAGVITRKDAIVKVALAAFVVVALVGVPVFLSGEPAEDALEHTVKLSEQVIEPHEDAARVSLIGLGIVALASAFALLRYRRSDVSRGVVSALLVAAIALAGTLAWTAHLGGLIRHTELGAGAVTTTTHGDDDD